MTQNEKELLLKDLCCRLPYGVKVQTTYINPQTKERKDIGTDVLSTVGISYIIDYNSYCIDFDCNFCCM